MHKDVFICVNKLLNAHIHRGGSRATATPKMERFVIIANGFQLRIGDQYHIFVDTRRFIWNQSWMRISFDWKVSQSNVSKSQNRFFHSTSSPQAWSPLRLGRYKDMSCLLNPLMPGFQKCNFYKNYFRNKNDLIIYYISKKCFWSA